jgi:uncharacterized protein (TIGR03067 family)
MRECGVLALLAGLLLAADPDKDETKRDRELLQGAWRATSVEAGGKAFKPERDSITFFEGDAFTVKKGDGVQVKGTFKIDTSKNPRTIDLTVTGGQVEGDKGKVVRGIYQVDKEALRWCTAEPGDETRPKEFTTKEGSKQSLIVFKRKEP